MKNTVADLIDEVAGEGTADRLIASGKGPIAGILAYSKARHRKMQENRKILILAPLAVLAGCLLGVIFTIWALPVILRM